MRVCSFLPSATEILFALGLDDSIVGVTYECDFPAEARNKPVVVHSNLQPGLQEREIDREVKESAVTGNALYRLDAAKLRDLQPDLIITQDLCQVCAATPNDLGAVLASLTPRPEVLTLTPHTVADVLNDILKVGSATGTENTARQLVDRLRNQMQRAKPGETGDSPRVLCLEWLEPPFIAGHWVPEMIDLAGGIDLLGRAGEHGYGVDWANIVACDPDVILAAPCGFHLPEVELEMTRVSFPPEWYGLRAVRESRVFPVDASSYFSRPGPRIVEGIEILAALFERVSRDLRPQTAA